MMISLMIVVVSFIPGQICSPFVGRHRRSTDEDIHVVLLSSRDFDIKRNQENMKTVEEKLHQFSDKEGITWTQMQKVGRTAENVNGKFGVHFTVENAIDKCSRVLNFIRSATKEVEEVVSATVKCGNFDKVVVMKENLIKDRKEEVKEEKEIEKKKDKIPEEEENDEEMTTTMKADEKEEQESTSTVSYSTTKKGKKESCLQEESEETTKKMKKKSKKGKNEEKKKGKKNGKGKKEEKATTSKTEKKKEKSDTTTLPDKST